MCGELGRMGEEVLIDSFQIQWFFMNLRLCVASKLLANDSLLLV
jgi:hypothetical protein